MSKAAKETLETVETLARLIHREALPRPDPVDLIQGAKLIRKGAATLDREAVKQCNGVMRYDPELRRALASWTDSDQTKSDAARAKAKGQVNDGLRIALGAGFESLSVEFQGDPRGAMVKLWRAGARDVGSPLATF